MVSVISSADTRTGVGDEARKAGSEGSTILIDSEMVKRLCVITEDAARTTGIIGSREANNALSRGGRGFCDRVAMRRKLEEARLRSVEGNSRLRDDEKSRPPAKESYSICAPLERVFPRLFVCGWRPSNNSTLTTLTTQLKPGIPHLSFPGDVLFMR